MQINYFFALQRCIFSKPSFLNDVVLKASWLDQKLKRPPNQIISIKLLSETARIFYSFLNSHHQQI